MYDYLERWPDGRYASKFNDDLTYYISSYENEDGFLDVIFLCSDIITHEIGDKSLQDFAKEKAVQYSKKDFALISERASSIPSHIQRKVFWSRYVKRYGSYQYGYRSKCDWSLVEKK